MYIYILNQRERERERERGRGRERESARKIIRISRAYELRYMRTKTRSIRACQRLSRRVQGPHSPVVEYYSHHRHCSSLLTAPTPLQTREHHHSDVSTSALTPQTHTALLRIARFYHTSRPPVHTAIAMRVSHMKTHVVNQLDVLLLLLFDMYAAHYVVHFDHEYLPLLEQPLHKIQQERERDDLFKIQQEREELFKIQQVNVQN